jgi:hypothetical protein
MSPHRLANNQFARPLWIAAAAFVMAIFLLLTGPGGISLVGIGQAAEGDVRVVDVDEPDKDFDNDPHAPCDFRLDFSGFTANISVAWEITTQSPTLPEDEIVASDTDTMDANGAHLSDPIDIGGELSNNTMGGDQGFHVKLSTLPADENSAKSKTFFVRCTGPGPDSPECDDGIDNDRDGFIDWPDDPGCSSDTDDSETNSTGGGGGGSSRPECDDFRDNDGDGFEDWPDDPGCTDDNDDDETDVPAPSPTPTPTALPARPLRCAAAAKEFNLPLVVGTKGADVLRGTQASEVICAKAGDDWVVGSQGDDIIWLGRGDDVAVGGSGADVIRGQRGTDSIEADDGNDTVTGGNGKDTVVGGAGKDEMFAQQHADVMAGGPGDDRMFGGPGNDVCAGGSGANTIGGCES